MNLHARLGSNHWLSPKRPKVYFLQAPKRSEFLMNTLSIQFSDAKTPSTRSKTTYFQEDFISLNSTQDCGVCLCQFLTVAEGLEEVSSRTSRQLPQRLNTPPTFSARFYGPKAYTVLNPYDPQSRWTSSASTGGWPSSVGYHSARATSFWQRAFATSGNVDQGGSLGYPYHHHSGQSYMRTERIHSPSVTCGDPGRTRV